MFPGIAKSSSFRYEMYSVSSHYSCFIRNNFNEIRLPVHSLVFLYARRTKCIRV